MKLSRERRSGRAKKGSQLHLQNLINRSPDLLNNRILEVNETLRNEISGAIRWVSPLEKEKYLEYQDEEFLEAIGYSQLKNELLEFWPEGGPVWDALATFSLKTNVRHGVILLEAKSHADELKGGGCGAKGKNRGTIIRTFGKVQKNLKVVPNPNWVGIYYQYANRLAHLYFLSIVKKIPTWLVFLYFLNDEEQGGPREEKEWDEAIATIKENLHLTIRHPLSDNIIDIFFDVRATD